MNVAVSFLDALLNRKKEIKNLGGKMISFSIPEGFNLKDEIRIQGEGMNRSGDLVIRPEIKTPKHMSHKAKKLLEDLEGEL